MKIELNRLQNIIIIKRELDKYPEYTHTISMLEYT